MFKELIENFIKTKCIKCLDNETDEEMERNSKTNYLIVFKKKEYYVPISSDGLTEDEKEIKKAVIAMYEH